MTRHTHETSFTPTDSVADVVVVPIDGDGRGIGPTVEAFKVKIVVGLAHPNLQCQVEKTSKRRDELTRVDSQVSALSGVWNKKKKRTDSVNHDFMAIIDLHAKGGKVQKVAARADGCAHDVVDLDAVGNVLAVHEEVGKVEVYVAGALWHIARVCLANDDEKFVLRKGGRGNQRAETCCLMD